jgi:glycosyltransferase involved in cell wall biosynthesis
VTLAEPQRPLVYLILPVLQPAGAEKITAELARRLPSRGFDVRVLCLEDERAPIGAELAAEGVAVEGLRLSRRRTLACAREIVRRLPERRPLVLHSQLIHANLATRKAFSRLPRARRAGVHVISTVQVIERRFRPWHFLLDRLTARHCDVEVCVSKEVEAFQREKTGLPAAFFRVVENAIDTARFAPPSETARPAGPPMVVSVGRLNRQKDFPTLLRAWRRVEASRPDARLVIAGSGPQSRDLRALAASLELRNLEFAGFVKDVPALLHKADLYVQSSRWEGLPLSVIEAMAARLPVIVTDAQGMRSVIEDGRTGLKVRETDPAALALAILSLLADPSRADRLALAAQAEARTRFSVDRMVDEYAAVYREVLGRS